MSSLKGPLDNWDECKSRAKEAANHYRTADSVAQPGKGIWELIVENEFFRRRALQKVEQN